MSFRKSAALKPVSQIGSTAQSDEKQAVQLDKSEMKSKSPTVMSLNYLSRKNYETTSLSNHIDQMETTAHSWRDRTTQDERHSSKVKGQADKGQAVKQTSS